MTVIANRKFEINLLFLKNSSILAFAVKLQGQTEKHAINIISSVELLCVKRNLTNCLQT